MWRPLTILGLVLTYANAFGQGKVKFENGTNHLFVLYGSPLPASPLPSGYTLQAVLYAGKTSGNLAYQTTVTLDASAMLSGIMFPKLVTLTDVPGGLTAYFQIFVTDMATTLPGTIVGGADYLSGATYLGTSGLFTAIPGTGLLYPSLAYHTSSTWPPGTLEASGCLGCVPPFFITNLSNVWVAAGSRVTLGVSIGPPWPLENSYQWRKQSSPIFGWTTNSSLTLTNVAPTDSGNYDVIAMNPWGTRTSSVATVTVFIPPAIATLSSPVYTANNQFQFTVVGTTGSNYVVQVATNLAAPMTWVSLFTNASPFTFVESNAQNFQQRFYRVYPP